MSPTPTPPPPPPGFQPAPPPFDGAKRLRPWYRKKRWIAVGAFVVIGAIGAATGGAEPEKAGTPTASESEKVSAPRVGDKVKAERAVPVDTDEDGVNDDVDVRPNDPKIQTRDDVDQDKDGVPDYKDAFPRDAKYSKDADSDGVADGVDDFPQDANYSKDADGDRVADSEDAFPGDPSRSEISLAMQNALETAENYLNVSPFSRQGLIDQLTSDYGSGFEMADATWAVDHLDVDWKQQAVKSARNYLDMTGFSRQGLIDQLSSPYGGKYTADEAIYAVNKIGL